MKTAMVAGKQSDLVLSLLVAEVGLVRAKLDAVAEIPHNHDGIDRHRIVGFMEADRYFKVQERANGFIERYFVVGGVAEPEIQTGQKLVGSLAKYAARVPC